MSNLDHESNPEIPRRFPEVIAALHLPPFQPSGHPAARPLVEIVEYALRNTAFAAQAGVRGLYLQDMGDYPWASPAGGIQPHTIAMMSVVGAAVRKEFPELFLGVCLMSHAAREPLAIAQAIGAQFVRLKVYIGAMVKAEGLVEGCAYEAVTYRAQAQAGQISILADVYDRSGEPLGQLPLAEAATQAAVFGRADGLILTGQNFSASLEMVEEVRHANLATPLLIGGSVNAKNVAQALAVAEGVIVSTAFKSAALLSSAGGWSHEGLAADWDAQQISAFMKAAGG